MSYGEVLWLEACPYFSRSLHQDWKEMMSNCSISSIEAGIFNTANTKVGQEVAG